MESNTALLYYDIHEFILKGEISEFSDLCRYMMLVDKKSDRKKLYSECLRSIIVKNKWEEIDSWAYTSESVPPQKEDIMLVARGAVGCVPLFRNVKAVNLDFCSDPLMTFKNYQHIKMVTTGMYAKCDAKALCEAFPQMTHFSSHIGDLIYDVVSLSKNIKVVRYLDVDVDPIFVEANPQIRFYGIIESYKHALFIEKYIAQKCENLYISLRIDARIARNYFPCKFNIDHLYLIVMCSISENYVVSSAYKNIRKLTISVQRLNCVPNIIIDNFPNLESISIDVRDGDQANLFISNVPFVRNIILGPNANAQYDPKTVNIYNPW